MTLLLFTVFSALGTGGMGYDTYGLYSTHTVEVGILSASFFHGHSYGGVGGGKWGTTG
jgi:hypothetical protein